LHRDFYPLNGPTVVGISVEEIVLHLQTFLYS
jgi:hypothetical protein